MSDLYSSASFLWFVIGFVFLLAELGAPGFIIIFFGFGAWTASLAAWLLNISLDVQIGVFVISSLLYLLALRRLWMRIFIGQADAGEEDLTDQPSSLGAVVEVTKPVSPSTPGEIKYRGTFWRAVSDSEFAVGESAVIVDEFAKDRSTFKIGPYTG